jgi:RNA polymerase sigma-70 factor (ECF subfamily)
MQSAQEKQDRFMKLLEPLQPQLERFTLAMTRDRETARDVISETLLIAYQRFNSLRDEQAFLSFLFTIATRIYRRRTEHNRRHDELTGEHLDVLIDRSMPPDVAADITAVYQALGLLPDKQREAVYLFEVTGLSMKEIQEIQGGTLVGVKVRISRGRKKLAAILGIDHLEDAHAGSNEREPAERTAANIDSHLYSVGIKP